MNLRLLATIAAAALLALALAWPWLAAPVLAQGPPLAPPVIALDVEPAKPEVGQEVTVSWQVSGAVSVSVRRDAQQVSTDAAGERSFTVADKRPITWAVAASNRAGATSEEMTVRPVTFGSAASFITSGMAAAGGLWVGQLVLAFVPGLVIILVAVIKAKVTPAPFIAAGGLAPVLAFVFVALFNYPAGYWLACSLTLLLVVSVVSWVHLEKA